ncbi:MAG: hypothetical protein R3D43_04415 [Tepidamorphaceae bacterium]
MSPSLVRSSGRQIVSKTRQPDSFTSHSSRSVSASLLPFSMREA